MLNPVQKTLDRMTFKPFWWFSSYWKDHRTIVLRGHHLTVSSVHTPKMADALDLIEQISTFPHRPEGVAGTLILTEERGQDATQVKKYIHDGWTLFDVKIDTQSSFWNEEGVILVVEHIVKGVAQHELEEFLRLDGKLLHNPHPDGGIHFRLPDLTRDVA